MLCALKLAIMKKDMPCKPADIFLYYTLITLFYVILRIPIQTQRRDAASVMNG